MSTYNDHTIVAVPPVFPSGDPSEWSIADARDRLGEIHQQAMGAVFAWSARVLDAAQLEVKQAFTLHAHQILEFAVAVEDRLAEIGVRNPSRFPSEKTKHDALQAIMGAPVPEFIGGIYENWLGVFETNLADYLARYDALSDWPSGYLLRRARDVTADIRRWGVDSLAAYAEAGRRVALVNGLDQWASAWDGVPYRRPRSAERDERYRTFGHTRDYRSSPDFPVDSDEFETDRFEMAWVNRDEIDAMETFLLGMHDLLPHAPGEVLLGLGRIALDEARHTELGHRLLAQLGHDPYGAACSMIGIDLRARMEGWTALAQISLFGELGIIGPMERLARTAQVRDDMVTAGTFSFICRDERLHLRQVRSYLARFTDEKDVDAVEKKTKEAASRILNELGLINVEEYQTLSKREIFQLIGE